MKKFLLSLGGLISAAVAYWGYNSTNYAKEWVDSTGRMSQQSLVDGGSSAWTIWPTSGVRPTTDSIAEVTLYRTLWSDPTMERISLSAMATADGGAYRLSIERANGGSFHPFIVCFENNGGPDGGATCGLKITENGVVNLTRDGGATWETMDRYIMDVIQGMP